MSAAGLLEPKLSFSDARGPSLFPLVLPSFTLPSFVPEPVSGREVEAPVSGLGEADGGLFARSIIGSEIEPVRLDRGVEMATASAATAVENCRRKTARDFSSAESAARSSATRRSEAAIECSSSACLVSASHHHPSCFSSSKISLVVYPESSISGLPDEVVSELWGYTHLSANVNGAPEFPLGVLGVPGPPSSNMPRLDRRSFRSSELLSSLSKFPLETGEYTAPIPTVGCEGE